MRVDGAAAPNSAEQTEPPFGMKYLVVTSTCTQWNPGNICNETQSYDSTFGTIFQGECREKLLTKTFHVALIALAALHEGGCSSCMELR